MATLYPTHTCFDDSLDLLAELASRAHDHSSLRLVHALCKPKGGELHSHAWVEDIKSNLVATVVIMKGEREKIVMPKSKFYKFFNPVDITRYTVQQACDQNLEHFNYGPWEERYLKGCRDVS